MSQYQTGTVAMTNASASVVGTATVWAAGMVGGVFKVDGVVGDYLVQSVESATALTLATVYTGVTASGLDYQITIDFTTNYEFREIHSGDREWAYHLTQTIRDIDTALNSVENGINPWVIGQEYTIDITGTIHGGDFYLCSATHTAAAATEPGVGADWATVWDVFVGSGDVAVSGTPVAGQVAVWTDAATIEGQTISYTTVNVNMDPANNTYQGGIELDGIAGEVLVQWDLVYRKYDTDGGKFFKFDANGADIGDYPVPIGMATTAVADDAAVTVVTGTFFLRSTRWTQVYATVGGTVPLWASTTAGDITLTPPATALDMRIMVGHLYGNDTYLISLPAMVIVQVPAGA